MRLRYRYTDTSRSADALWAILAYILRVCFWISWLGVRWVKKQAGSDDDDVEVLNLILAVSLRLYSAFRILKGVVLLPVTIVVGILRWILVITA